MRDSVLGAEESRAAPFALPKTRINGRIGQQRPGPLTPQYMAGAELERMTPFGVLYHGVGLMITAFTASERMSIGFIGDRDSLPHRSGSLCSRGRSSTPWRRPSTVSPSLLASGRAADPRPDMSGAATSSRILDAVTVLLAERDWPVISVGEVAEAAGVSR